jgi:thiosulfate/3-mercaptopyruvate sulfurtransferase
MVPTNVPAIVSTAWLATHLADPDLRVADVRWYLPHLGRHGRDEHEQGHIPGAVFVDLESELAAPRGSGPGRHPLPGAEAFGASMSRAGVGPQTHVVAYDDTGGSVAARLWWLLRYFGHERVSVLDGGIGRWTAEGRPLTTDAASIERADFVARPRPDWVVARDDVRRLSRDTGAVVLDARAPERYEGRVDPRAGHIPGAVSAPFAKNLRDEAAPRMKAPGELREWYASLGAVPGRPVVVYCGSGVNACHNLLGLQLAGVADARLYEGSWSDWSADPDLPAATGPAPG